MSSVLGLKARPNKPMVLPFNPPTISLRSLNGLGAAIIVDLGDGIQNARVQALFLGHVGQGLDILGKARTTPAQAGIQEMAADARVIAHAGRDFLHIRADAFAQVSQFVHEGDLGRQEGIGGVLDHLGGAQVGDDDRRAQGQVQLSHFLGRLAVQRTDHGAMRAHEIANG